ncbi:UDP-2,4-diacetamido-2,4,6-trideoxy-beta-L-altropyranose hydrolase [Robertmurraya massiliosenegalensis]|uniref:UDP-2,4-diacetamido-2,4, 6-trideoxy-beta-L-altropyranose hydrolase n=1 Tax=Robertmurraya massiliosenegalensis TaxID=1287657 RepID=UPI0002FE3EF8|nr:UDP-2,4-diacetamido-2,4,6-trideoxy-beta-L-altropyranose hydrolase [Robertmurraya massiliosenegalensis]
MDILIRADASVEIGSGHVMRCLTIAEAMKKKGHQVTFFMEVLPGDLTSVVEGKGYPVVRNMQSTDICIIDHYQIDEEWEKYICPHVKKIVVIDDLANRRHECDVLIDQNVVPNFESRYDLLVPNDCKKLLGPNYLIMRDEFIAVRVKQRERTGEIKNLLVFMGGTDPTNETMKVLKALKKTNHSFEVIHVVVGNGNVHKEEIRTICAIQHYEYHCQIDYMAKLMNEVDFSIGAGGSTTWERCYVGLPSSSTIVADNQITATETAAKLGAVINLGWHEDVSVESYMNLLHSLPKRKEELLSISQKGLSLTESQGEPNAWISYILELRS